MSVTACVSNCTPALTGVPVFAFLICAAHSSCATLAFTAANAASTAWRWVAVGEAL